MDVFAPSIKERALRVYREEGITGVLGRTLHVAWRTAAGARARLWRRHRPPLTAIVLSTGAQDIESIAEVLLVNRARTWKRWLSEVLIVGPGPEPTSEAPTFVRSVPVRFIHVDEREPSIVANIAVAVARTDAVLFCDEHGPALTTALLQTASTAFRRGVDVLCPTNDAPVPPQARRDLPPDAEELALVEKFLLQQRSLIRFALRRRHVINTGLFHPEDGDDYVARSLVRIWRQAAVFVTFARDDPSRLAPVSRYPISPDGDAATERPPRVIYFVNGTDVRGGIRIVFEHCNRLRERGIEAIIASFDDPIQTWFPLKAPLIAVRDLPSCDVAVATFWTTADFVAQLNCARYYFIQHDETLFEQDDEWAESVRKTYRLPIDFITISTWLVDLIRNESGKEALLVPNGINRDMFYPDPAFPRGDKIRVLVEGNREIFWKGIPEAEEVLDGIDAEVWTLGNAGIEGARSFVGRPQDEVRRVYSSCDILLKTSWYEGMPLPHMEAMACGCALVTTDVPGVRDYCVDGWNCLTAEPRNVQAIRKALVRLIEDPELRKTLIEHGLETARDRFGWDEHMDRLAETYVRAATNARQRFAHQRARQLGRSGSGFGRRRVRR